MAEAAPQGNGADHDAGAPPLAADTALAALTLTGDIRDYLIRLMKRQHTTWALMTELGQTQLAREFEYEARALVRRVTELVAGRGFHSLPMSFDEVAFKPKQQVAKFTFGGLDAETRHALVDSQGTRVVMVLADPDIFDGVRGAAAIDPQEPELPGVPGAEAAAAGPQPDLPGLDGEADPLAPPPLSDGPEAAAGPAPEGVSPAVADPYNAGYEGGRQAPFDVEEPLNPHPEGTAWHLLYLAGWHQARIDAAGDDQLRLARVTAAVAVFRDIGHDAYGRGDRANPFPAWMLAHKAWNEGGNIAGADAGDEPAAADADQAPPPPRRPRRRGGRSRER